MIWKGKNIENISDFIDAVTGCNNKEEAQEFMSQYQIESPYAKDNIGYLAGYLPREQATKIFDWFEVCHPIFGTSFPTAEEMFKAGLKLGELVQKHGIKKAMQMSNLSKNNLDKDNSWHVGIKDIFDDFARN